MCYITCIIDYYMKTDFNHIIEILITLISVFYKLVSYCSHFNQRGQKYDGPYSSPNFKS